MDAVSNEDNDAYVLYQYIHLDLIDIESKDLVTCKTDLYLTFEKPKNLREPIFLHFRQGIVSSIRY